MKLGPALFTVFEGMGIALDAIRSNKVRAALTILGVAVGVFVVVALSSAVTGSTAAWRRISNPPGQPASTSIGGRLA
jgi:hypothetical protein